jgi:hypothetical protein
MLNTKNYIFFALPYLTVVCSLYHLVYYSFFGLNGLALISVGEIIKSALYPILLSFLFTSLGIFIAHKFLNLSTKQKKTDNAKPTKSNIFLKFIFLLIFNSFFLFILDLIFDEINYVLVAFAFGNILFGLLDTERLISKEIEVYIDKEFLLMLLIYLPCFSIATAIQDAYKIITNKSYKYSVTKSNNTDNSGTNNDTLKFIGMSEQNFLFTDLKNQKIYFIKSDSLVLQKK